MPGDRHSTYRQVARELEARILAAQPGYGPGWVLPSAVALARQLGLGHRTVTAAYRLLAQQGLITLRPGYGAQVREQRDRKTVPVPAGTVVTARMPTLDEQDRWQLDPGVPVLEVGDGVWPADRYELVAGDEEPPSAPEG